jgi:uncharacterized OB-fold protein
LALQDAGLKRRDLDGLLLNPGLAWHDGEMLSNIVDRPPGEVYVDMPVEVVFEDIFEDIDERITLPKFRSA